MKIIKIITKLTIVFFPISIFTYFTYTYMPRKPIYLICVTLLQILLFVYCLYISDKLSKMFNSKLK